MHKEIEEAREWSNARPSEFAVHDFKRWCLKGTIHARRLLSLFDRMQQEPVVEISASDRVVDFADKMSPGRYRRELEHK